MCGAPESAFLTNFQVTLMLLVYGLHIEKYDVRNNLNHLVLCILASFSPDMPGISASSSQLMIRLGGGRQALCRLGLEPELTTSTELYKTPPMGVPCISSSGSSFDPHFLCLWYGRSLL